MSRRSKPLNYAVTDGYGSWVVGISYPPKGQEPEQDAVRVNEGVYALVQREPFEWPSAGPFTWVDGRYAADLAMRMDGVVALAPPPPTPTALRVGDRVTQHRGKEVGVVREFVVPEPGWYRALILWPDGTEQYVDLDKLRRHEERA